MLLAVELVDCKELYNIMSYPVIMSKIEFIDEYYKTGIEYHGIDLSNQIFKLSNHYRCYYQIQGDKIFESTHFMGEYKLMNIII